MLFVRARNPEALAARARLLREQARRRVGVLEARWKKRRLVLEKALAEFQRNLEHLRALEAEGRYPRAQLAQALLREELRVRNLEEEIRKLDETFRMAALEVYRKARLKVASLSSRSGLSLDLDTLFPEVKDEPVGHA